MKESIRVDFEPIGRRVRVDADTSILTAARKAGIGITAVCNGQGTCHQCVIRLVSGKLNPLTDIEKSVFSPQKQSEGWRLACQTIPISDVSLEVPPQSISTQQRLQLEGQQFEGDPAPAVRVVRVSIEPASPMDLRADQTRLKDALETIRPAVDIPIRQLDKISPLLRTQGWQVDLVLNENGTLTGGLGADKRLVGLALDIGTTKLAAYLVDLESGKTMAKMGEVNPQISYGEDVISRIAYANQSDTKKAALQKVLRIAINRLIKRLCKNAHVQPDQIMDAVVVGNTAMHHLFAGLPVRQLGEAPYVPGVSDSLYLPAHELGLNLSPGALVYLPPNIAGFVGSDHISADLACGLLDAGETTMLVDIGTNTEITLRTPLGISCCSCASGPAFEGAHIHSGMRAAAGAIERVFFNSGQWNYTTIGQGPPAGICGSGILDAVAEMRRVGIIDERGVFQPGQAGVEKQGHLSSFQLVPADPVNNVDAIQVTRKDVNEIQLAKAAIRAGIEILLKESQLEANQIQRFIVAGAFGTYLHLPSALAIGMFPPLPEERFFQAGNAAGAGARYMLLVNEFRKQAEALYGRMKYIELTIQKDFQETYMASLLLDNQPIK
ncbi:MAG: DUF4445 domain-containing protein [Anaerolineaceae bacterium]|nr:DUF4445 domain-containing protein [Anaerolineaceae bacterium]